MDYIPFKIGQTVTNNELSQAFKVGNMGGMRKSNTYNCLVLISDHTKGLYEDKWYDDELHYTGMGKIGNQVIQGNQYGTVYYSKTNGIILHLFEVLQPKEYIYRGIVKLSGSPYQEDQPDESGNPRKVWMFPLRVISGPPVISQEEFQASEEIKQKKAKQLSLEALHKAAISGSSSIPGSRLVITKEIIRNHNVIEYAKHLSNGFCSLCGAYAPFIDASGEPFLEIHHIIWLSEGGSDSIDNTVALCPNCHRKIHILKNPDDINKLKVTAKLNAQK